MPILPDYLICPECKSTLQDNETSLQCQNCLLEYEKKWDIPIFSQNKEFYYCPTKKKWLSEKLDAYYEKIQEDPNAWELLLQEILDKIPDNSQKIEWIENLVDESRTVYKYLTSLKPDGHVLNFGSGWDNTTINLARTAKKVTAYDLTKQRIQTLALKKKYYGLDNIDLFCGGDRPYLPFKDNCFDTIFINGVLEWVASDWSQIKNKYKNQNKISRFVSYLKEVYGSHNPREIQIRFLKEMRRVLKDDGEMYIGIENRYSRLYFGKRPDHHSFIWFGSLYPRFIAHLVSLIQSRRPYITFTYSVKGMKKLVKEAGFNHGKCFGLEPMYRTPNNIFNLDHKNEIEIPRVENEFTAKYFPNWLYKKTVTSYGYITTTTHLPKPWIESVMFDFLEKQDVNPNEYYIKTIKSNKKEKLSIFVEERNNKNNFYVIKVPITFETSKSIENNYAYLQSLHKNIEHNNSFEYLSKIVPCPILASQYNGQKYFVESGRLGIALKDNSALDNEALRELPYIFKELNKITFDEFQKDILLTEYDKKFRFLESLLHTKEQKEKLSRIKNKIIESIGNAGNILYLRKSDFSMSNILVDGLHVSGIIDFDETSLSPYKSKNFAEFILSYSRYRQKIFWSEAINAIQKKKIDIFSPALQIEKNLEFLNTNIDELALAVQLAWLNHVYYMTQFEVGRFTKQKLKPLFHKVLEDISDTII